jgi:hypothetical protein
MARNPDLFEKVFSQMAKNIKKKEFIFSLTSAKRFSLNLEGCELFLFDQYIHQSCAIGGSANCAL